MQKKTLIHAMNPERLRFTYEDDITLLKEVISQNPFENNERWKNININVIAVTNINFSLRAIRDHTNYLLQNWRKDNNKNLKR